jgi:hypothetical protein
LLFIVRAFFKNAFAVAIWTSFHVRLMSRSLAPARVSDLKQRPTQKGATQPALREGRGQPCEKAEATFGLLITRLDQFAVFRPQRVQ